MVLHTVGGVAAAGETLMLVVPSTEPLLVNVRIDPIDVDKVFVGQQTMLRFSGLNRKTTPELVGSVSKLAPDATQDPVSGQIYYETRIAISDNELMRLPAAVELVPGMPVEAFVQTGDRTALSYIVDPALRQLSHAMREE